MPYCPKCEFEYVARTSFCPECGAKLVAELPPKPLRPALDPSAEVVRLCRVADATEADLICAALREAGIAFALQTYGPVAGGFLAVVTDGQAPDDARIILVSEARLAEAQVVLAAVRSASFEWPAGMEPEE